MQVSTIGLGDANARLQVLIGNQPNLPPGFKLDAVLPLAPGDISELIAVNSNHWRKVFNLYAKLGFALHPKDCDTWQTYRDRYLLQADQDHALIFSPWQSQPFVADKITLICGKTYACQLGLFEHSEALGEEFFLNRQMQVMITPYFDYRALSNRKLARLTNLIRHYFTA